MTNHMDVERLFPLWGLPMRLTTDPRATDA